MTGPPDPRSHQAYLRRVARDRAKLGLVDDLSAAPTVDALAREWVRHRVKAGLILPRTGRYQLGELDRFRAAHGKDRTMRADKRVFERWLEAIGDTSVNTRRVHVSTIRGFVTWAVEEGYIHQRALTLIPKIRATRAVPRALDGDQSTQLILSLADEKQRAIVGMMLWMGLRCAEVAGMKVEDVSERERTMHVTGKGGHERVVPIPPEFAPFLTAWLDLRRRTPGPLITTRFGGHYNPTTVSTMVSRLMRGRPASKCRRATAAQLTRSATRRRATCSTVARRSRPCK